MKYQTIMFASAMAFASLAGADEAVSVSKDEMADYQVECLEAAYGDELTGEQKDRFVQECVQQKLAAKKKGNDRNG